MTSEKAKARRVLVAAVNKELIPLLVARGFDDLRKPKEPIPMWDLHRPRSDGGYDAISIIFDKKRRPLFYAVINVIAVDGVRQPWGEFVEAKDASAATPLTRVMLLKQRHGVVAMILPRWFGHDWFGFRPVENAAANQSAAVRTCEEFASGLDQAERWWVNRELGPNLVPADVGIELKGQAKDSPQISNKP